MDLDAGVGRCVCVWKVVARAYMVFHFFLGGGYQFTYFYIYMPKAFTEILITR